MAIEIISDLPTFLALETCWNGLVQSTGMNSPQLSHAWLCKYWKHLASDCRVAVLVHRDKNSHIVGFTPLMVRKRGGGPGWGIKELTFLADDLTDESDFILTDTNRGQVIAQEILPYIEAQKANVDRILLRRIPQRSPNWKFLKRAWGDSFSPTHERGVAILGMRHEDYQKNLGKNIRHEVNKRINTVERAGLTIEVSFFDDWSASYLQQFMELDTARQSHDLHGSAFSKGAVREWIGEIFPILVSRGELAGWQLRLGGELAAYRVGFKVSGAFLDWQTSYSPKYAQYDPGKILLAKALADCFDRGITKFDFLMGMEAYKLAWMTEIGYAYTFEWRARRFRNRLRSALSSARLVLTKPSSD